jgi:flagellar hook-length control protein FliK
MNNLFINMKKVELLPQKEKAVRAQNIEPKKEKAARAQNIESKKENDKNIALFNFLNLIDKENIKKVIKKTPEPLPIKMNGHISQDEKKTKKEVIIDIMLNKEEINKYFKDIKPQIYLEKYVGSETIKKSVDISDNVIKSSKTKPNKNQNDIKNNVRTIKEEKNEFIDKTSNKEIKQVPIISNELNTKNNLIPLEKKLNFKDNLNLLQHKNNAPLQEAKQNTTETKNNSSYKTFESVKTQLQDTITYLSQNNRKQVVLKLNPEHLGKLEINISLIKNNTKVEIKVQKNETLQLLNDNQVSLKDLFSTIKKTDNEISFSFDKNTNSESNSQEENKRKHRKNQIEENKFNYLDQETISKYMGLIEIIV